MPLIFSAPLPFVDGCTVAMIMILLNARVNFHDNELVVAKKMVLAVMSLG